MVHVTDGQNQPSLGGRSGEQVEQGDRVSAAGHCDEQASPTELQSVEFDGEGRAERFGSSHSRKGNNSAVGNDSAGSQLRH